MQMQFIKLTHSRRVSFTALALLLTCNAALAAESIAEDALAQRISMVRTLLFESSAARGIKASSNEEAHNKRAQAIALFESASAPGDQAKREQQLNAAVALLYEAVAAASTNYSTDEKDRRDFDNRQRSLEALLAAHERIMREKGLGSQHEALLIDIDAENRSANDLLAEGKVVEARAYLDRAYDKTKLSVERSREGETLIRELKFETPKDEYLYELDRNDTHRMLLTVLLQEKMKSGSVKKRVETFVVTADKLRAEAVGHAGENRFEEATEALERSTTELVKAIRGAGVYIPG